MIVIYPVDPQPGYFTASGIVIDGTHYALAGQPPIARSKGWGNMAWARQ